MIMICKICGTNETDNPDGICDDCKYGIISNDDIPTKMQAQHMAFDII